jgi:crossover junction endodeoxyribonuclease RuvC
LGLDPGSLKTGFGVVEADGADLRYVAHGCIAVSGADFAVRMRRIHAAVAELLLSHAPDAIAIERVFVNRNVDSALKLGQARGAALAAVPENVPVHEYAPRAIKMAVVGVGSAEKAQVQHMVSSLLRLERRPGPDAADALAIAICHASHGRMAQLTAAALRVAAG